MTACTIRRASAPVPRGALRRHIGALAALLLAAVAAATAVRADDTEIFRATVVNNSRPKVLIIFDDSGSMNTIAEHKPAYDHSITYPTVGTIQSGRIYWATGNNGDPPATNTSNWFNATRNRCASSYTPLANDGFYTDDAARWNSASSTSWSTLSSSSNDPLHVDCHNDVANSNTGNGSGTGNPGNGYPRSSTPRPYGSTRQTSVDDSWSTYRFYSANYMNWYYSTTLVDRSRIEVAQTVVASIIEANPGIDFGLELFNNNSSGSYDGGRIVSRIIENMSSAQRDNLVDLVNATEADGYTPLCESMYEAYRYFAGQSVMFGLEKRSSDTPARDTAAESGGNYVSPIGECEYTYVILMTDGLPTRDTAANSAIETLIGHACTAYPDDEGSNVTNCMPDLARYMYENDLDHDDDNGPQRAITYTIGFTVDHELLRDTAEAGGGLYYTADSVETLTNAFQGAITAILSANASFTSPSVAVDTFTRTESRNEVFFAMFEPQSGTNWPGNIKKLGIDIADGEAVLVDANGNPAIDTTTGHIKSEPSPARTFWSTSADGPDVDKGGAGALLAARDPDTRVIYSNTGTAGAFEAFNSANMSYDALGLANNAALFTAFDVANQGELDDLLAWARGWTDSGKTERRPWILGDILHSRPLVLNYGLHDGHTAADPDLRIVVGTNAGFLHVFDNTDGEEDWAFFPKELAGVLARRRDNVGNAPNVYGIDSAVTFYRKDLNNDGTIDSTVGDKLYIYFGLRGGGKAYYALDVSDPDSPAFLWRIDDNATGMSELGQSWSVPVVAQIPGYADVDGPKPVLIFGGGYDPAKDSHDLRADQVADADGRAIFIVDAVTGALVWSVTPAANGTRNLRANFTHSMPATVTVYDSNGDELVDRIYSADTGGNVWRIDLPGNALPASSQTTWRATRLARLGTSGSDGHAGDRRFFNAADVVRTRDGGGVFDAVLLGSGDRTNPNATDNDDRFYMLKDRQTRIYATPAPSAGDCSGGSLDARCSLPILNSDLYAANGNLVQAGTDLQRAAAQAALAAADGWYIALDGSDGEKSLSRSLTIDGTTYVTTFAPGQEPGSCEAVGGTGRLYALNLLNAAAVSDFSGDGTVGTDDRDLTLGTLIPDTPSPHFGSDKRIRLLFPAGGSPEGVNNPLDTGASLRGPYGTYWQEREF